MMDAFVGEVSGVTTVSRGGENDCLEILFLGEMVTLIEPQGDFVRALNGFE